MLDTKQKVINHIEQLSSLAAALSKAPAKQVLQLRDELLALPGEDYPFQPGGRSGLNADGSPLQFCISSSINGLNGRFISDPACIIGSTGQRYSHSYDALQKLYEITGSTAIQQICEDMLSFHLPVEKETLDDYPDGVLWLGASPDMDGIAVYMDGRRGGNEASWQRLRDWLNYLMPQNTEVDNFIDHASQHAGIMSIGLEGSSMENLRAKVYFRLSHPSTLNDLAIPLLLRNEFSLFLDDVVGEREIRLSGLVFNIGFHIASGKMFDAKIDICGCNACVNLNTESWMHVIKHTTSRYLLTPFPISAKVLDEQCAISYYGIGVDRKGDVRMNLYLKNKIL
ncbi:hypothetical protein SAMN05216490_2248 [Mucilaginibacter mallensis]|uniref:Uncharacterized protein n=1 Tax=Mucilaginibacter mallensis TaxID=652787 RepID=A0A1H1WR63_MUCMA|nr:hypothetical protein [Mucilaginibacter mallensis]SDS99131.1 hypothetical protein SAMN05216490_2248 [Mucilaginibacter mallensis]